MRSVFRHIDVRLVKVKLHVSHFNSTISACRQIKCQKVLSSKLSAIKMLRQVCLICVQLDNYKQCRAHAPTHYDCHISRTNTLISLTHSHTLSHTRTHTHHHTYMYTHILTHTPPHTHALSHTLTHAHTHLRKCEGCWPRASNPMLKEIIMGSVYFGAGGLRSSTA